MLKRTIHALLLPAVLLPALLTAPAASGRARASGASTAGAAISTAVSRASTAASAISTPASTSAATSPTITPAQAEAFAAAIGLKPGDLAGSTALRGASFAPEAVQYKALRCGRPAGTRRALGGGESWLVDAKPEIEGNIGSIVSVAASSNLAAEQLRTLAAAKGRACLERVLGEALTFEYHNKLDHSHTVSASFSTVPGLGEGAIRAHVHAKLPPIEEENPPPPPARYIDVEAALFHVGPAEVELIAIGSKRLPPAIEARLLALLHRRAQAHTLSSPAGK